MIQRIGLVLLVGAVLLLTRGQLALVFACATAGFLLLGIPEPVRRRHAEPAALLRMETYAGAPLEATAMVAAALCLLAAGLFALL